MRITFTSGKGDGRVYTVTYEVTDGSGNTTTVAATVTVPHDLGKKKAKTAVLQEDWVFGTASYPNPFNSTASIRYALPDAAEVELTIYDVMGQRVRVLVDAEQLAGVHIVHWDGRDGVGRPVSTGVYFYRLRAGGYAGVGKMIFAK